MDGWLRTECNCKMQSSAMPSPLSSTCKPQNRYLCYLLDEFEKCSQQSSDLSKLQKVWFSVSYFLKPFTYIVHAKT